MSRLLLLLLHLIILAKSLKNCQSDSDCFLPSSRLTLYCHPSEQKCTECLDHEDCYPHRPFCTPKGSCTASMSCNSDLDCQSPFESSSCVKSFCKMSKDNLSDPSKPVLRNLGVTTTVSSSLIAKLNIITIVRMIISKDEKVIFAAAGELGLVIIDVSDPSEPKLLSKTGGSCLRNSDILASDDGKVVYLLSEEEFCIYDVQNLESPVLLSLSPYGGWQMDKFKSNSLIGIVDYYKYTLRVINVFNPAKPIVLLSEELYYYPTDVIVFNNDKSMIILTYVDYIIVDLSVLTNPTIYNSETYLSGDYIQLSPDEKLAYVAGDYFFQIVDISDISNIKLLSTLEIEYIPQDLLIDYELHLAYVPLVRTGTAIYDIYNTSKIVQIGRILSIGAVAIVPAYNFSSLFIADYDAGFLSLHTEQFASSVTNNILGASLIKEFSEIKKPSGIVKSQDETLVYVSDMGVGIHIINVSDYNHPYIIKTLPYPDHEFRLFMKFSHDFKYLFYCGYPEGILIFEMTDPVNPKYVGQAALHNTYNAVFDISFDGNLLATSERYDGTYFYDIKNKSNPVEVFRFDFWTSDVKFFRNNPNIVAIAYSSKFAILNIADFLNVHVVSEISARDTRSLVLSSDENYAFVANMRFGTLVVDIRNISNISLVTIISGTLSYTLYRNENMLYIADGSSNIGVYATDITDPRNPVIKGLIKSIYPEFLQVLTSNILLLCDREDGLKVINMNAEYVLKTDSAISPLGTTTDFQIILGKLLRTKYIPYNYLYKIIQVSLYKFERDILTGQIAATLSPLHSWMKSDFQKGLLTFSSYSQTQISSYDVFIGISTYVDKNSFIGIGNITTLEESAAFLSGVLVGKYVDPEGYLTLDYDPEIELNLEPKYSSIEERVREVLSRYYIQSTLELKVVSSLEVFNNINEAEHVLAFDTPSLNLVIARLVFENLNATFMDISYDTSAFIGFQSSGILITGSAFDVNIAIANLRVDLKNNIKTSAGEIVINDGLNPSFVRRYPQFTGFFSINRAPYEKVPVGRQIKGMEILTGIQFSLILEKDTFVDPDNDPLIYRLLTIDGNSAPSWLRMVDTTIMGTPPEEFGVAIVLKIVASDGYKATEALFKIEVSASFPFILSIVLKSVGPIFGVIGLWVYALTIYNILFKHRYTFPEYFQVKTNIDVDDSMIFPISLYGNDLKEALKILREIKRSLSKEPQGKKNQSPKKKKKSPKKNEDNNDELENKISEFDMENIADIEILKLLIKKDGTIDEMKLENLVEETVKNSPNIKLSRYMQTKLPHYRLSILKIIKEKLTMIILKRNKATFLVFEALILGNWGDLCKPAQSYVDKQSNSQFDFELREDVFLKKLAQIGFNVNSIDENKHDYNISSNDLINSSPPKKSIVRKLVQDSPQISKKNDSKIKKLNKINPDDINLSLLKEALVAYFKSRYNLGMTATRINFRCLRVDTRPLIFSKVRKFLKLNLVEMSFNNKNYLGLGLKYKIVNDMVHFYGNPYGEFEGNTLVFQILTRKQKILREIYIKGYEYSRNEEVEMQRMNHKDAYEDSGAVQNLEMIHIDTISVVELDIFDLDQIRTEGNRDGNQSMEREIED